MEWPSDTDGAVFASGFAGKSTSDSPIASMHRRGGGSAFGRNCTPSRLASAGGMASVLELCDAARPPTALAGVKALLAALGTSDWGSASDTIARAPEAVRAAAKHGDGHEAVLLLHRFLEAGAPSSLCLAALAAYPRAASKRSHTTVPALGHLGKLLALHIALLQRSDVAVVQALLAAAPATAARSYIWTCRGNCAAISNATATERGPLTRRRALPSLHMAIRAGCSASVVKLVLAAYPPALDETAELRWSHYHSVPAITQGEFGSAELRPLHVAALRCAAPPETMERAVDEAVGVIDVILSHGRDVATSGKVPLFVTGSGWEARLGEGLDALSLAQISGAALPIRQKLLAAHPHPAGPESWCALRACPGGRLHPLSPLHLAIKTGAVGPTDVGADQALADFVEALLRIHPRAVEEVSHWPMQTVRYDWPLSTSTTGIGRWAASPPITPLSMASASSPFLRQMLIQRSMVIKLVSVRQRLAWAIVISAPPSKKRPFMSPFLCGAPSSSGSECAGGFGPEHNNGGVGVGEALFGVLIVPLLLLAQTRQLDTPLETALINRAINQLELSNRRGHRFRHRRNRSGGKGKRRKLG
eukprot:SAG31_NODE_1276_length_9044_cov_10.002236_2_plen_591_part_00